MTTLKPVRLLAVVLLLVPCLQCSRRPEVPPGKVLPLVVRGDADALEQMLDEHPHLVRQRFEGTEGRLRDFTLLHLAAQEGQLEAAKLLLERGADPNAEDADGRTPLHAAARRGDKAIVLLLKYRGAEVNATDSRGATPLHLAARHGVAEVAHMLAQPGTEIDATNDRGETPLHLAAQHARLEIARILLKRGADVNARDKGGGTPRQRVPRGHRELKMMLTEIGARAVRQGWTDLERAAAQGDLQVVGRLLDEGAEPEARSSWGQTPLLLAAMHGHRAVARKLVAAGAHPNSPANGYPPLCHLAREGAVEASRILLELGAEPAARCVAGQTPLHVAAAYDEPGMVELLLQFNHPVDARDMMRRTPLHKAAECDTARVGELLLDAGAEVNAVDVLGNTPLSHAREFGTPKVARFLEEHGATWDGEFHWVGTGQMR